MAIENLTLQLLDVFAGQHPEFFLETLGEILGRIESHVHREFVDADVGLVSHDSAGLFQSDTVDESRYILSGQGTEAVVERGRTDADCCGKLFAVEIAVVEMLLHDVNTFLYKYFIGR